LVKIPGGAYITLGEESINLAISINLPSEELAVGPITEPSWILGINAVALFASFYLFQNLRQKT
jgi:hypothetical protein